MSGSEYDIIFDTVGKSSFARCKDVLTPQGIYLVTVMALPAIVQTLWTSVVGGKRVKFATAGLRPTSEKLKDLAFLKELIAARAIKPVIDRCYSLAEVAEAHRYVETGRKRGNVAIMVVDGVNV